HGITVYAAKERVGASFDGELFGAALYPHLMSGPLYLVFAKDLVLENFVKTQVAGVDVHVRVIELLHKIQPEFATLSVKDEGEYWASGDRKRLQSLVASTGNALAKLKETTLGSTGPIKRPDGRIIASGPTPVRLPGARQKAIADTVRDVRFPGEVHLP